MPEVPPHITFPTPFPNQTNQKWKLVLEEASDGATNLALDGILLDRVSKASAPINTYLRFYGWKQPTLSLGFAQKSSRVIDFDFCRRHQIQVVRRITGGRAVLHHREVTYAVISNDQLLFSKSSIEATYYEIARALSCGLQHLDIETSLAVLSKSKRKTLQSKFYSACFTRSHNHEILFAGKKLIGSAQRRTNRAFLQHGSILLDLDPDLSAGAIQGISPPNLASSIATVKSCLGYVPDWTLITSCLQEGFRQTFQISLKQTGLDQGIRAQAKALGETTYLKPKSSNYLGIQAPTPR